MKVKKESEKAGLKLNIQETNNMVSGPISLWQIDRERVETVESDRLYFLGLQNHCRWTAAMKLKAACSLERKL